MPLKPPRRAFTLIELLTVIAIIGVLVAMLIPTVGAVRGKVSASICASNLRQLGVTFRLFAADNANCLPIAGVGAATAQGKYYWRRSILPYVQLSATDALNVYETPGFVCPEHQKVIVDNGAVDNRTDLNSYAMNRYLSEVNLDTVGEPARVLLASEARILPGATIPTEVLDAYTYQNLVNYHGTYCNILYVDGHVAPFEEIAQIYAAPYVVGAEKDIWSPY